jgi:hypothetical protein
MAYTVKDGCVPVLRVHTRHTVGGYMPGGKGILGGYKPLSDVRFLLISLGTAFAAVLVFDPWGVL